jgi:putative methyltransferase (TIGR04325 family)
LGAQEIARAVLASQPCRALLGALGSSPGGRRILNRLSRGRGVFDTFDEACVAANLGTQAGHNHPDAIRTHLELSKILRPSDYAVLYWLARISDSELRILDFGGNVGNLYYSYSPFLRDAVRSIDWNVFDLPEVTQEGRRIAKKRGVSELTFTDSLRDESANRILLVSGAFHYWEKSVTAFLGQFSQPPAHILLNRTPILYTNPTFATVQHADTYAVPCLVRNGGEMVAEFSGLGYTLVDRWPALELSLHLPLFPDRSVPHYSGFYFRRE